MTFLVTATMHVMNGTSTRTYRCKTRIQAERWRDELDDYQCVTHTSIEETATMSYRDPTPEEVDDMTEDAYRYGLEEAFTDKDGTDWDRLVDSFEVGGIDLGTDADSPTIKRIRAAYRRGLREGRL